MDRVLILYATVTGNSSYLALELKRKLDKIFKNKDFFVRDASEYQLGEISQPDLVIFISSTRDQGQLNYIAEEFMSKLIDQDYNISGLKVALIGLGDSSYEDFCGGLKHARQFLTAKKASLVADDFKIDGFVSPGVVKQAVAWAKAIIKNGKK